MKILVSIVLLLATLSMGSCVSKGQYDKTSQELSDTQSQLQSLQAELISLQDSLADSESHRNMISSELTSARSQNQSLETQILKQKELLQGQINTLQNELDETQAQAQNSLTYADFLDLLMTSAWQAYEIPSYYEYQEETTYSAAIRLKAASLNDDRIDYFVQQIVNGTDFYESQKATMILIQYIIQKIENLPQAPILASPPQGATMDNGRDDFKDSISWDFDWADVPGATDYQLYVIGPNALIPVINVQTNSSSYHNVRTSYIANENRFNWTWRVRAKVDGKWSGWSEIWQFNVEPLNTDLPNMSLN